MKTYQAKFSPEKVKGVFGISLVENPAMEGLFIALSEQKFELKSIDDEKRILMGLVLEPNKPIYRNQGGEEFNIVFDEPTITELSHGFFKQDSHKSSSIEHDKKAIEGVTFVESWIVEDSEKDKSANFGFSYPKGSWIATMKVDNDEIWNDFVKTGKVKGFSIDAFLSLEEINLKSEINMSNQVLELLKDLPNQIKLALAPKAEVKLGKIKTSDGSVTIEYEGDMLEVGKPAFVMATDGTKVPVPVGEHALEDGTVLVVTEEGVIGEIKPASAPAEETPMSDDADAKQAQEIATAIKSILVKYSEQEERLKSLELANTKLKEELVEMGKQPAKKPVPSSPTQKTALTAKGRILETLRNS